MEPAIRKLVDISDSPAAMQAHADMVLERARWAAQVFQRYDRAHTAAITEAAARVAYAKAGDYAEWAVRETGFGVVAHKKLKNELSSLPLVEYYRDVDFVNPQLDESRRIVKIPKPAGVIFALVPSTNPIATIYFKTLAALMTRNAIVISPHPAARESSVDAVKALAEAAEKAGAPEGIIQVIENPSIPMVDEFMKSDKTDVILATGGTPMVRAAYSSSNPAIGVGPGNAPVLVDDTGDLRVAADHIVEGKSFDNSVLCTNESVVITLDVIAKPLLNALSKAGCYICSPDEVNLLRRYLFHERGFNVEALGRDANWIAKQAGIKNVGRAKVLVTPITQVGVGEELSREKLCPVLAFYSARSLSQAITQARAVLRYTGAGHSAAIHSNNNQTILDFAAAVEAYRIVVNAPCSQGAAGFTTDLPPTFTIGTGFFGRSSVGENIGPKHLVNWSQIAWHHKQELNLDAIDFSNLKHPGPLQDAPADGVPGMGRAAVPAHNTAKDPEAMNAAHLREQIRLIISEELKSVLKDS
jgi:acyl-CoA reductase-like NAD-dependent aldehyde dehydrogenase